MSNTLLLNYRPVCPGCGHKMGTIFATGDRGPKVGDHSACLKCFAPLVVTELTETNMVFRVLSDEEFVALDDDTRNGLKKLQKMMKRAHDKGLPDLDHVGQLQDILSEAAKSLLGAIIESAEKTLGKDVITCMLVIHHKEGVSAHAHNMSKENIPMALQKVLIFEAPPEVSRELLRKLMDV